MRNVKLKDGSTYPVDLCNIAFGSLQINIADPELTVRKVAYVFSPKKTETVTEIYDGVETPINEYTGFTELVNVGLSATGVYLTLRKPPKKGVAS